MDNQYIVGEVSRLAPNAEAQWQRLRRQVERASGFWLGFLFCQSPQIAATIRVRIEHLLRFRARAVEVLVATSPDELGSLLQVLFEPAMAAQGLVWVEAVRADWSENGGHRALPHAAFSRSSVSRSDRGDSPAVLADQPGPWTAAWDKLLLLLNERRDALGRHLQGGLMMVAPVAVKPRARVAAPDLWSIRSVVMELPAQLETSPAGNGDGAGWAGDLRRRPGRRGGCVSAN